MGGVRSYCSHIWTMLTSILRILNIIVVADCTCRVAYVIDQFVEYCAIWLLVLDNLLIFISSFPKNKYLSQILNHYSFREAILRWKVCNFLFMRWLMVCFYIASIFFGLLVMWLMVIVFSRLQFSSSKKKNRRSVSKQTMSHVQTFISVSCHLRYHKNL